MGNVKSWAPVFDDDLIQIDFPDGEWVKVKRYITVQDQAAAQNAMDMRMMVDKKSGKTQDEAKMGGSGSFQLVMIQRMVKAWSFKRSGAPIPCDAGHVALLPEHAREFVMKAINDQNAEPTEEESENLALLTPISLEEAETALLS